MYTQENFDFQIEESGPISRLFVQREISTFIEAAFFISSLPYRRNKNKYDLTSLFDENCGTCSTKHAVLKTLAMENDIEGLDLMIGIFKMNATNTRSVASVLHSYGLEYIPEAHCYLMKGGQILDFTKRHMIDFVPDLLESQRIWPHMITDYKINFHRDFLRKWLQEYAEIPYSLENLWQIREACISVIS